MSGWDDPVTDGIEEILGKEKIFFCRQVILVEELPSLPASTMPAGSLGEPMAVGPPIILSVTSQDAFAGFAGIFSGADPQSMAALIEDMKRASRAQAAAAIAQESAWNDIAAYYRSITNNK